MNIPTLQEWQLKRLLYELERDRKLFRGLLQMGFYIRHDGIDLVERRATDLQVMRTMGQRDIQFYQDTLFQLPHSAVQVNYPEKRLLWGMWADNIVYLREYLKEKLPNENTDLDTDWLRTGWKDVGVEDN